MACLEDNELVQQCENSNAICITRVIGEFSLDECKSCPGDGYKAIGWNETTQQIDCENINECLSPNLHGCDPDTQTCQDRDGHFHCSSIAPFTVEINLPQEGDHVLHLIGKADDYHLGHSVSSAGDVNGDGIADIIIGVPSKDSSVYGDTVGAAYVFFGRANGTLPNMKELDGTQGFAVFGKFINDKFGQSVSSAGDINGDGIDDIIIGAPGVEVFTDATTFHAGAGEAYVIFGSNTSFPPVIYSNELNQTNGFVIQGGFTNDEFGHSVSYAGDVNNDGISDVIIGAPLAEASNHMNAGKAYVIFGSKSALPSMLNVNNLDGTNGFDIEGEKENDFLGMSVSFAGDHNGDNIDDFIIGATSASNSEGVDSGAAYVIYGSSSLARSSSVKSADLNGANGFAIYGNDRSRMGSSVAFAGDVNADGIDDVIIGAPRANIQPRFASGDAYIVYGSTSGFISPMNTTDPRITTVVGKATMDGLGTTVKSAGDINGDGIIDIIIGAPYGTDNSYLAEAYILYGSAALPLEINAIDLKDDVGMTIPLLGVSSAEENTMAMSVSSAGDMNSDGHDDLIVGLPKVTMVNSTFAQGHVQIILGH